VTRTSCGAARRGAVRRGAVRRGEARCGAVRRDAARHGAGAWRGEQVVLGLLASARRRRASAAGMKQAESF